MRELTELSKISLQTIVFHDFLPTSPPFLYSVFSLLHIFNRAGKLQRFKLVHEMRGGDREIQMTYPMTTIKD